MVLFSDGIGSALIEFDALPWMPFLPYPDEVSIKFLRVNPNRGEWVILLKTSGGIELPKHHHAGTLLVYTIAGQWRYKEHDLSTSAGSFVDETAASSYTPVAEPGSEVITMYSVQGDLDFLDENGAVIATENWRSMMDRYLAHCASHGLTPIDISSFQGN